MWQFSGVKIILAGGTGFIGRALLRRLLDDGHDVVLLSRSAHPFTGFHHDRLRTVAWDGQSPGEWTRQFDGADAVVNLSGAGIADGRWSAGRKRLLVESRLKSTHALVTAMLGARPKPQVFVCASAVGYYGDVPSGEVAESAPQGRDFLADLCGQWEKAAMEAQELGVRVVCARIGVVLALEGGALGKFIPPFKAFIGGPLGSGRQAFPWIHRDDVAGAIAHLISNKHVRGPVNLTAPETLTMRQFCDELGRAMRRPSWLPVPGFALRLLLGELAGMVLTGQRAVPAKLAQSGYAFKYPHANQALAEIFAHA
ncbi:MAG: Epimerase family protein [Candidatus Omnitrophica bacterium]|nr:Epimerase family protein [Candidatus Omnitrophota bacterium]